MLAKRTSKNQVTLPKAIVQTAGEADYYDVTVQDGKIVLTPIRLGKKAGMSIPRVVLDTNCLISALIFSRGKFA